MLGANTKWTCKRIFRRYSVSVSVSVSVLLLMMTGCRKAEQRNDPNQYFWLLASLINANGGHSLILI